MTDFHGIENQPSSSANDDVPMPSQTILTQSQSEICVTAQSSIPNRSDAKKRKATEVSDQDVKKTKLSVETRSHFEPHRTKANRVVCKHCKFDYYVAKYGATVTFVIVNCSGSTVCLQSPPHIAVQIWPAGRATPPSYPAYL